MTIRELPLYGQVEVEAQVPEVVEHPADEVVYSTGFESGADSWVGTGTNKTWSVDTGTVRTGTSSLKVLNSSGTAVGLATRTVTGLTIGADYTFSVWGTTQHAYQGAYIGVTGIGETEYPAFYVGWSEATYSFTATGTSHELYLSTSFNFSPSSIWFDDITLSRDDAWTETTYNWTPLSADATGITIRRGGSRSGLGVRTDVGLATFTLNDAQDPLNGGVLSPGMPVKVTADSAPIFTGRIAFLNSVYPLNKSNGTTRAVTQVTVADAVQIHTATQRYGVDLGEDTDETFEERIARLEASAQAPVDAPVVGAPIERYVL